MQRLPRALAILALLTALLASACTTDTEDPASADATEATASAPTEAAPTSTPLAAETARATATETATPTRQRNSVGGLGDYPFVVLVEQATADLLEDTPPDPVLTFEEVATHSEALERIEAIDAAGLILDAATYADFPLPELVPLYDEGRVIVAFEVPLDELQLSLDSGERTSSPPGSEIMSPFYSVVRQTRPDVRPETRSAQSARFLPEFLHVSLAREADIAAGRIRP